jgi:hypothetical protein
MSQTPYVLRGARFGYRLGHGELEDYLNASLNGHAREDADGDDRRKSWRKVQDFSSSGR